MRNQVYLNVLLILIAVISALGEHYHDIVIDGQFSDWGTILPHIDPDDDINGTVLNDGVHDCHDTYHTQSSTETPTHVFNPNANILEYKFAHSEKEVYAYMKVKGNVGRTTVENETMTAGSYFLIVAINVDENDTTGYSLYQGGFFPTSVGYDMSFGLQYFNGSFNAGFLRNHGACDNESLIDAWRLQREGVTQLDEGNYPYHTSYIYWPPSTAPSPSEAIRCPSTGLVTLPNRAVTCLLSEIKVNGPFQGGVQYARSKDRTQVEISVPMDAFMVTADGEPIVRLGNTIHISFSTIASGEFSLNGEWVSDTANPIRYYVLEAPVSQAYMVIVYVVAGSAGLCVLSVFGVLLVRKLRTWNGRYIPIKE